METTLRAANSSYPSHIGWTVCPLRDFQLVGNPDCPVTVSPDAVAFDPVDGELDVAEYTSNNVSVVSPSSGRVPGNSTSTSSTYTVGFQESGLPAGTTWAVALNGTTSSSNTSRINFSHLANNTTGYAFSVTTAAGYMASPATGTVAVNGANVTQNITFQQYRGPTILGFNATPNPVGVGHTTTLGVFATGLLGTFVYTYTGLPPGCATADFSSLLCTPTGAGDFTVRVFVNYTGGGLVERHASLDRPTACLHGRVPCAALRLQSPHLQRHPSGQSLLGHLPGGHLSSDRTGVRGLRLLVLEGFWGALPFRKYDFQDQRHGGRQRDPIRRLHGAQPGAAPSLRDRDLGQAPGVLHRGILWGERLLLGIRKRGNPSLRLLLEFRGWEPQPDWSGCLSHLWSGGGLEGEPHRNRLPGSPGGQECARGPASSTLHNSCQFFPLATRGVACNRRCGSCHRGLDSKEEAEVPS